ncbi:MAG TPA: TfoX/Sxy family protein [Geobacteraceae bacterium]
MTWPANNPATVSRLEEALRPFPCSRRQMFGCPVYFAGDNMLAGVHADRVFLRLAVDDRADLLAAWPGTVPFEPLPGRPMREYLSLPPALVADPAALNHWLARGHAYVATLPPKPKMTRSRG